SYQATGREWDFTGPSGGTVRVSVSGRLNANSGDLLLQAACGGEGIVLVPTFLCAEEVAAGRLVPLLRDWTPMPGGAVHALFHESRNLLPKVRVFVDYLAERFGAAPSWDRLIADARPAP
ncbi:MAG: LysR substrate-binding domain-containing protein, partial [Acetobacterales bacterium]